MNASKENCRRVRELLNSEEGLTERSRMFVFSFLEAAERKLPKEESYRKVAGAVSGEIHGERPDA